MKPITGAIVAGILLGVILTRNKTASDIDTALTNKNVQAFLAMIRRFESGGQYDVIFGGQKFTDFSSHPNVRILFDNPATNMRSISTAAGAYQITYPTWLTIQAAAFLPDFDPRSQDKAAVWLLKLRGALGHIVAGEFDKALAIASKTWAALPYSTSGQPRAKLAAATTEYKRNGGVIA